MSPYRESPTPPPNFSEKGCGFLALCGALLLVGLYFSDLPLSLPLVVAWAGRPFYLFLAGLFLMSLIPGKPSEGWDYAYGECNFCLGEHQEGKVYRYCDGHTMCHACFTLAHDITREVSHDGSDDTHICTYCNQQSARTHIQGNDLSVRICSSCVEALSAHTEGKN